MSQPEPYALTALHRAFSPTEAESHHQDRAIQRPLFIAPRSPPPTGHADRRKTLNERKAKLQRHKSSKPRPLSAAKKRALGLNEIPKEQVKWDIFVPLHRLWLGYMRDILGIERKDKDGIPTAPAPATEREKAVYIRPATCGPILASADMHGALLTVVRSRCVSRVGIKGIVVRDTKFTFEVVTERDVLKAVPKEHTMFRFEIPIRDCKAGDEEGEGKGKPLVFEIMGEQFQHRPTDRANKKYKMHYMADL